MFHWFDPHFCQVPRFSGHQTAPNPRYWANQTCDFDWPVAEAPDDHPTCHASESGIHVGSPLVDHLKKWVGQAILIVLLGQIVEILAIQATRR